MSSSTPNDGDISGDDYLKVLICSANVGNAEPTPTSFGAWVPYDGEIHGPLTNTPYPVGREELTLAVGPYGATTSANNNGLVDIIQSFTSQNTNPNTNGNKFDIIVLGMQEAAFVNKQKKEGNGDNGGINSIRLAASSESDRGNNNNNSNSNSGGVSDNTASNNNNNNNNNSDDSNSSSHHKRSSKSGFIRNPLKKGAKKAAKAGMVMRGISANQTYKRNPTLRNVNGLSSPSSITNGSLLLGYDNNKLADLIQNRCPSYEIVTSSLRGEMRLFVLAHSKHTNDISDVYVAAENTGIGSIMANKGGIIVTLTFRNTTRLSFMTCHLEAHEGMNHYIQRNKNLAQILGGAKTDPIYTMQDATIISHHMFLCGDLNYRIKFSEYERMKEKKMMKGLSSLMKKKMWIKGGSESKAGASCDEVEEEEGVDESNTERGGGKVEAAAAAAAVGEKKDEPANGSHFDQAKALVEAEDWKALNDGDELAGALKQKECLVGFSTLPCHWPPTFKVERGEGYQYNEKRTPSYTDRILWKSAEGMVNNVIPFLYEPCPEFITSDHKPIRGGFAVKLNKDQPPSSALAHHHHHHDGEHQIQIIVSDLKCTNLPIMDNELIGGLSDPYVLFVSSPKELLYSKAWPSSSIISRNLNPVWKEDMHLTMDRKGMRYGRLAEGSMLMLTVMDYDATSGDDVIGSVALNLNELCSELDLSGGGGPSSDKVQETLISRPILRNGQEYGMLECKLKTAFLTPREVKSFLSGAKNVRTATKTSWKSKIQALTGFTNSM